VKRAIEILREKFASPSEFGPTQVEEVEHLGSFAKSDGAALLPERQSGDPDGDEPVLAERQPILRMADHVEKKPSAWTPTTGSFPIKTPCRPAGSAT